jgi:hypothetical protein
MRKVVRTMKGRHREVPTKVDYNIDVFTEEVCPSLSELASAERFVTKIRAVAVHNDHEDANGDRDEAQRSHCPS